MSSSPSTVQDWTRDPDGATRCTNIEPPAHRVMDKPEITTSTTARTTPDSRVMHVKHRPERAGDNRAVVGVQPDDRERERGGDLHQCGEHPLLGLVLDRLGLGPAGADVCGCEGCLLYTSP